MDNCPHCSKLIHFIPENTYAFNTFIFEGSGDEGSDIATGFCPACKRLIVIYRHGYIEHDVEDGRAFLTSIGTEEIIYPKHQSRKIQEEVPDPFKTDFLEAAVVLTASPKASAAISRRSLQNLLREKFDIKPSNLASEIDAFLDLPGIPSYVTGAVDAIRNIGNYAAHPIKKKHTGEIVAVEEGEAEWLLEVLEALFDFVFVQPQKLEQRKKQLNDKLKSLGKPPMKGTKSE